MRPRFLLLFMAFVFAPVSVFAQTTAPAVIPVSEPVLHPGDKLRITVWHNPEYSGEFLISDKGTLAHPQLKNIVVAGIPMSQVEIRIRDFLATYNTDPQFVL